jgi:hypothetical protein
LTSLSLGGLPVTDAGLAPFQDCKQLTEINVGTTQVTDTGLALFKDCKNLTSINFGAKHVTDNVPNATKIGFFGGSTIWGTGADDNNTIPAIFDQLTSGYEVTNYGEGGHNARQMMASLVNLIDTGHVPDVVVFYGGFNHIWTHCNYAVTRSLNSHMVERKLRQRLTERPRGGYLYASLIRPPLDFARRIIGEKRFVHDDYACHDDPERAQQVAATMLRIWESADVLVNHWGGRFYAFLQPVAYLGQPRLDHLDLPRLLGAEQFRSVYPIIQEKAAARGAGWFTDLSDSFDVDEYIYIDDAHVSGNGNAIIARRILERITADEARLTASAER